MSVEGRLCLCCRATVLGPQVFSPPPHKLYSWRKRQPSRFCRCFLNIFNIVSFKRNVLHGSSKEQRTSHCCLGSDSSCQHPFPKKSQFPGAYWTVFGGRWGKLPAQPSRTLVWGLNLIDLTWLRLPSLVDRNVAAMASIPPWGVSVRTLYWLLA